MSNQNGLRLLFATIKSCLSLLKFRLTNLDFYVKVAFLFK